jgi:PAS domain S-box-containing protein
MSGKTLATLSLAIVSALMVLQVLWLYDSWNFQHYELNLRAHERADVAAVSLAPFLATEQREEALDYLNSRVGQDGIRTIVLQRRAEGQMRDWLRPAGAPSIDQVLERPAEKSVLATSPIFADGQLIGQVTVVVDTSELRQQLRKSGIFSGLSMALVLGLTTLLTFSLVRQRRDAADLRRARDRTEDLLRSTRAAEEKLRTIYENAEEGILQVLPNGGLLSANPAMARIAGYKNPEEMLEKISDATSQLYVDRERRARCLEELAAKGSINNFESKIRRHDGTTLWISENIRAVSDSQGNPLYFEAFATDVSKRKLAESEARKALEDAVAASRAKNKFLAVLSHEMRTPLTAILGYCEMLLDEVDAEGSANGDLLRIKKASEDLLALLDDLLDISRVESGEILLMPHRVEIAALMQEVADQLMPLANKSGNQIEVNTAANLGMMLADGRRLKQVLLNVVGNAVKYTAGGRVTMSAYRQFRRGEDWIIFLVQDTGQGISESHLHQLAEELNNPDLWTSRADGSAGLGLTISNRLLRGMGGTLTITSDLGKGTTVEISIPAGDGPFPAEG